MIDPIQELPDVEAIIVRYPNGLEELRQAGVKQIAGPESPNNPKYPMVYVHRFGGTAVMPGWLDNPRVQIDVWGLNDTVQLRRIGAKVRAALHRMPVVQSDGVVKIVGETLGPQYFRASDTRRPRYLLEVEVTAHPLRDGADLSSSSSDGVPLEVAEDDNLVATLSSGGISIEEG